MDIRELLRHLRRNHSDRAVARDTRMDRKTVAKYRIWAAEHGLLTGQLPSTEEVHALLNQTMPQAQPPQSVSSVEPYREFITALHQRGVEAAAIYQRLKDEPYHYQGSYSSVWRFVQQLEALHLQAVVRVEVAPGEEAQVDFGYAGLLIEPTSGELDRAWAFVMTLSWSRHQYVEFVFDQTVRSWLLLHRHAFEFFAGVPGRVVIDNLKAAIVKASWDDPQVQRAYRELAEYYGFLIAPCRPKTPRHKGKVEQGGVHYVKRNFLAGREPTTITQANRDVLRWAAQVAGQRQHGTTREKPLERFIQVEQAALQPLPDSPYDLATWKRVKLHRDCHVVFENAYYSAPYRLVGQDLWVRGGTQDVRLYNQDHQLVATHSRARKPGERLTRLEHLPPEKVPGLTLNRDTCRQRAEAIGPATSQAVARLLDDRPVDRLRTAGRLLKLAESYDSQRLEAACARALYFDDPTYSTVKRILEQGLETVEPPSSQPAPAARTFTRSAGELLATVLGGGLWS